MGWQEGVGRGRASRATSMQSAPADAPSDDFLSNSTLPKFTDDETEPEKEPDEAEDEKEAEAIHAAEPTDVESKNAECYRVECTKALQKILPKTQPAIAPKSDDDSDDTPPVIAPKVD